MTETPFAAAGKWSLRAGLTLMAAVFAAGPALAAGPCKQVKGKLSLQSVTGPACQSAVGICVAGSYSGGIAGTSLFAGTNLIPTGDTPTTGVVLLTGDNIIHTSDGDLLTKDALVLRTTGAGEFAEVDTIISGTGSWSGATGTLSATGTLAGGIGEARYSGTVCLP